MFRLTAALLRQTTAPSVDAVVVGAGPAGLAAVGNLLEQRQQSLLWVDPSFGGGRVNARYREVPSNTKVDLFLQFANALGPFRQVVEGAAHSGDNAVSVLRALRQDKGCELGKAADLVLMLTEGLKGHFPEARQHRGRVTKANLCKSTKLWTVTVDGQITPVTTSKLVLCTGSSPITNPPQVVQEASGSAVSPLSLDTALKPSLLETSLDRNAPLTVAVVGASHSAILVLMNLYNLAATSHPHLRIKWFTRHRRLRYAKPMDGWILYDNTGLKGDAADWARSNLDEAAFDSSPVSKVVQRCILASEGAGEAEVYRAELPGCTHMVQAIGYQRGALPVLSAVEQAGAEAAPLPIEHDGLTGRFTSSGALGAAATPCYVPGLFGAGIAFPERVTDPAGNTEHAVGFWKFMKFLKRVVPEWTAAPDINDSRNK